MKSYRCLYCVLKVPQKPATFSQNLDLNYIHILKNLDVFLEEWLSKFY